MAGDIECKKLLRGEQKMEQSSPFLSTMHQSVCLSTPNSNPVLLHAGVLMDASVTVPSAACCMDRSLPYTQKEGGNTKTYSLTMLHSDTGMMPCHVHMHAASDQQGDSKPPTHIKNRSELRNHLDLSTKHITPHTMFLFLSSEHPVV